MLEGLPRERWPTFGRGDCGYGNEATMLAFEERALPYLFKQRHTPKVKILVQQLLRSGARWQDAGDGWEAIESSIKLRGWSKARRLVLVREPLAQAPAADKAVDDKTVVGGRVHRRRDPQALAGAQGKGWESIATPWSGKIAVLVTSLDEQNYPTLAMPRLYRERSDAENVYDELKNQWGWNGYTTRKLAPSRIMASLVALFYNWWNLYVRFYDSEHHREAITSRPALMQGVGRQVQSGGQRTVKVTLLHEYREDIAAAVTLVSKQLHEMNRITERWTAVEKWSLLLTKLLRRWLGGKWLPGLPAEAGLLLSG